ncbi:phospholipase A [Arcobacter vandammei]|uniref:phospholipase A n=1 Tax=Arcobacter vandammei TaxID=2782243 RepID=UPI0018DF6600|nr:phospholipase A [Arcobacter vandammei]
MKKFLSILTCTLCFASNEQILIEAQKLEDEGNFKAAMLLYKQVATLNNNKEDKYLEDINKNSQDKNSSSNLKRAFFERQIDPVDDKETKTNLEQIVTKDFGIYPYKKNYVLPLAYTFKNIEDRHNFETTFQISIEKPLFENFLGLDEIISLAYTQKSYWQTTKHSSPFRETNYEPEIFIQIPIKENEYFKALKASLIHSSNGKKDEQSRSLNRIYLEGYFQLSNLFIAPKVWYRIPETNGDDDNPDFHKYYGYGDLSLLYAYKQHTFELLLRNNLRFDKTNKGAFEFNWTFPLPEFMASKNSYGLFQAFHGYGQSLIDYDREITNIGLGIAFSR